MKKILMTLAALLCCWVTITVFTACGDDDDNTPRADDTKPAKIAMVFHFLNTPEMVENFNIEYSFSNGLDVNKTVTLNDVTLEADKSFKVTLAANLPCTLKFSRKVTLKNSITEMPTFSYTKKISCIYGLYNAAGKQVLTSATVDTGASSSLNGEKVTKLVEAGSLDYEHVYTFDANGNQLK